MAYPFLEKLDAENAKKAYEKIQRMHNFALASPYTEMEQNINILKFRKKILDTFRQTLGIMRSTPIIDNRNKTKYEDLSNKDFFDLFFNSKLTKNNYNEILPLYREYINRLCDTFNVPRIKVKIDYHPTPDLKDAYAYFDTEHGFISIVAENCIKAHDYLYEKYNLVHNIKELDENTISNFTHYETLLFLTHEFRHYCVYACFDNLDSPYYSTLTKARIIMNCSDDASQYFQDDINYFDDCYLECPDEIDARGFALTYLIDLEKQGIFEGKNFSTWFHEFYGSINGKIQYDIKNDSVDIITDLNSNLKNFVDIPILKDSFAEKFANLLMTNEDIQVYYDGLTKYQRKISSSHTRLCKKEIELENKSIRAWVTEKAKTYDFSKCEKFGPDSDLILDNEDISPTKLYSSGFVDKYEYFDGKLTLKEENFEDDSLQTD